MQEILGMKLLKKHQILCILGCTILFVILVIPLTVDAQAPQVKVVETVGARVFTWAGLGSFFSKALITTAAAIATFVVIIEIVGLVFGWLLWATGVLFDLVVNNLVIGMGRYVTQSSAVYLTWTIMRDLANIGIIGGLVAAAFGTILNLSKINAKTLLARLIIAALLVNFSYFFAAAMIDVSNFTAGIIYKTTISKNCTDLGGCTITNRFMQVSNFQALAGNSFLENSKTPEALGGAALAGAGYAAVGPVGAVAVIATADFLNKFGANTINLVFNLMFIVFLCVTIYVFLSAISLLLGRFVALVLLIVASPLGIAGLAVPGLQKYAQEWWSALASQALFAPIYFLLVGISLMILDGFVKSAAQAGKSAVQNAGFFTPIGSSGPELLGVFVSFLIAITFMLLSLRAAKEMSKSKYLEG